MSFPGGFPVLGDRPSRSYASPPLTSPMGAVGGVRNRIRDGDEPIPRRLGAIGNRKGHRPTQSTPNANANTSYFPIQAPPAITRSNMFLVKAPPPPGSGSFYENPNAMESGLTLGGMTMTGGGSSQAPTYTTGGGGGQTLGVGMGLANRGTNPDDMLVLPSMLPRGRSDGILPASSMQMQSLRPSGTGTGTGGNGKTGRLTGTRYHGPTLASPPIVMGTPGYGLSQRESRTGMTESERIKAAYLKGGDQQAEGEAGVVGVGQIEPEVTPPRKKKKKKTVPVVLAAADVDPSTQQQQPEPPTSSTTLPVQSKQQHSRPSQSQAQDAFLSWPGHTALGVLIPNNPSTANLPLPLPTIGTVPNPLLGNGNGTRPSRQARTGANGTDLETPEERRARIRDRRERRQRRDAGLDGGVVADGTGGAADGIVGAGSTPRRSRTRRGTGDGMGGGGEDGGGQGAGRMRLLRGASMRRANVWDGESAERRQSQRVNQELIDSATKTEVPESNEQELPEGPPSFPYPTPSTTRLPPAYQQSPSEAAGRPISPPPTFDEATFVNADTTPDVARQGVLETLHEGDEGEADDVAGRPDSPISETASSVVPDDEAPDLRRKRELRRLWSVDVKAGLELEERLKRDEERRRTEEKPEVVPGVVQELTRPVAHHEEAASSTPADPQTGTPKEASQTVPIADNTANATSPKDEASAASNTPPPSSILPDEDEDDEAPITRYSKEEKGKGRAVEVASIMESGPGTPRTMDTPVDRPIDMQSIAETHGSESEADFVSVKEGDSARASDVQNNRIVDQVEQVTPRKSNGWRQVDAQDTTPTEDGPGLMLGEVVMGARHEEEEDRMEVLVPLRSPGETALGGATIAAVPTSGTPSRPLAISVVTATSRPRGVSNASRISRNAAGSAFIENLPEVTGEPEASPISPVSVPPTPPAKDVTLPPASNQPPSSPVVPRPLFKRGASDKAKNENPWAFMRRVSTSTKTDSDSGGPDPVLKVSPLAVESPKRPERTRKLSKLANQLFRPSLGLPAEAMTPSPEKPPVESPSIDSSDEEGVTGGTVLGSKPAAEDIPSRLAALARRDLLAPIVAQPVVKRTVSSDATSGTVPYIHPFNRAVRPAWMMPAKFNLPASIEAVPSRSYAPADNDNLEAKLGWSRPAQSPPAETEGVYQLVPPPSWPVMSEAVTARRRAPPPIPVKASPDKDGSSSDDDSGSDSDDGSSSYEWSISDVVPRRSGAYRLLPPKGLPAEVLRGPAEPHPHYRSTGESRVRPRGPRNRGDPPPLPPRHGQSAVGANAIKPTDAAAPVERRVPPPPPAPVPVPIEADWSLVDSPLLKPPIQRQLTANEKILATLIPTDPQIRAKPTNATPGQSGDVAPPTKRKVSAVRTKDSSPALPTAPPAPRPSRLVIKPRFDDRPEQEMQSQLSKRVNKWRIMAIDAEVDNLIQEPEPDSEPEKPVVKIAAPMMTHSKSVPNLARLQAGRTLDPASPRPETSASNPGPLAGVVGPATPDLHEAEAGPSTRKELEYTDLDLAVARATENGREFEAFGEVTSFLENAGRGATADELTDLLIAPVELESRRTTKDGKVKLKLAALGVRVTKCAICQLQYKEGHMLAMMPGCGHTGHQKCVVGWLRSDSRCMICRQPLRPVR